MKQLHSTREQWLLAATALFRDWFTDAGHSLPPLIRVSTGFPSRNALSNRNRAIGQCWPLEASSDGSVHIFISPVIADPLRVSDVLIHELCHAADNGKSGHKGEFKRIALSMGLVGKMTCTEASPELVRRLDVAVGKQLGEYPHAALDPKLSPVKKQTTRLLKALCGDSECGYTIRVTQKWIDDAGLPVCPCGERFVQEESEKED